MVFNPKTNSQPCEENVHKNLYISTEYPRAQAQAAFPETFLLVYSQWVGGVKQLCPVLVIGYSCEIIKPLASHWLARGVKWALPGQGPSKGSWQELGR